MWYVGKGDEKRRKRRRFIINFDEMENSHLECGGGKRKKKYVICVYFNGKWLKDSSFFMLH
jgi:hypothetical protein